MMEELRTILRAANILQAVVVDDAYDELPLAKDLATDAESWRQFFEDLQQEDIAQMKSLYPQYDNIRGDELQNDNEFIAIIWQNRDTLREEVIGPLFARYIADKEQDRSYLKTVTDFLFQCGIASDTAGRMFEEKAAKADLVIIDLFLGSQQDDDAMRIAVDGLNNVVQKRRERPPLVILMSRSGRLESKRPMFRDEAGLFESAFRIVRKTDLSIPGKLLRLLTRLARHYSESVKLAVFLNAWTSGLANAAERTARLIRTLDLPDHAHIQQLLLTEEGEPSGSYLVDIFDRVLQHEVEGEGAIITAALELNQLDSTAYPPPYVAGSRDLQALVFRTLFQNKERLRLVNPTASAVAFGDLLRRKPLFEKPSEAPTPPLTSLGIDDVLLVVTPACDLQRQTAKRCLLLKGSLTPLRPENWTYKDHPIRTAVYEVNQDERYLISWDLKHVESASEQELRNLMKSPDGFQIVARLRESHALEIQQKLLSTLGRVGLLARMPATFPVQIEAYLPAPDLTLFHIPVPALNGHPSVIFQGHHDGVPAATLVITEDACEAICQAIESIDLERIHPMTRPLITELRATGELLMLEHGIDCTKMKEGKFMPIDSTKPGAAGGRTVALLRPNGSWVNDQLDKQWIAKAGLILTVTS